MKLFGLDISWFGKKGAAPRRDAEDEPPAKPKSAKVINIIKLKRVKNPVLALKNRPGSLEFEQPEYDMAEAGRIADVEAYVRRAFSQKEGLMFKEGWSLVGKNPNTIQYIKERFNQISAVSGKPTNLLLRETGADLIGFHNAYWAKVRDQKASGGAPRKPLGRDSAIQPVAAYFPIPVGTMRFKRDDNGSILKYRQELPDGRWRDFDPADIVHFYASKKQGMLVGTPLTIPLKDDIRALRRIEENIELLVYQHLFPLYHYTVGTETAPAREYPNGTTEVDVVQHEVEIMPAEGMIVTPERHKIEALGAEGRALRAESYLLHFKKRIFSGLGVSAIDMGEGDTSNRSTADSMSRNLVDDVKAYQDMLELFVNEFVIKELLLESTFPNPIDDANIVQLRFAEIDLDSKIKVENHAVNSFGAHAITHSELRRSFGLEPLTEEEWEDTFWNLIEKPRMIIQAVDEPYTAEAKAAVGVSQGLSNAPPPASGAQATAKAKTQPSNQHGTNTSPAKKKSSLEHLTVEDQIHATFAGHDALTDLYDALLDNSFRAVEQNYFSQTWFSSRALVIRTQMIDRLQTKMRIEFRAGARSVGAALGADDQRYPFSVIESRVNRIVGRLIDSLTNRISRTVKDGMAAADAKAAISLAFDALRYRCKFVYRSECNKAHNYGAVRGLKKLGHAECNIVASSNACETCKRAAGLVKLEHVTIDDVPGFHPNCTCRVERV